MKNIMNFIKEILKSAIKWYVIDVVIAILTGGVIPPFALMAVIRTAIKWKLLSKGLDILQRGFSLWGNILTLKEVIKEQEVNKTYQSGLDAA